MKNIRNKLFYSIATFSICTVALSCSANSLEKYDKGLYIRFDIGRSIPGKLKDKNDAYDFSNKKTRSATVFNLGVGHVFNKKLRGDVSLRLRTSYRYESSFKDQDIKMNIEQKFKSTAIMFNGYYDIAQFSNFTPYVNLGLGYSRNKALDYKVASYLPNKPKTYEYIRAGKTSNNLAWNIGLGSLVNINDSVSLDISYKYLDLGKFSTTNTIRQNNNIPEITAAEPISTKIKAHDITAGVILKF